VKGGAFTADEIRDLRLYHILLENTGNADIYKLRPCPYGVSKRVDMRPGDAVRPL
jgi:hypothetical protein